MTTASRGTLYVVATPIGNLSDITLRAIETLTSCHRVAAEDTRQTKKLLSHLMIGGKPVDPLHAHSSDRDVARLVEALDAGESIALVTDAGTPVVSDPGDILVKSAITAGIRVVPIPGPSAVLAALVASGLGGAGFRFFGFIPREGAARHEAVAKICATPEAVVLFESPERTTATLRELAEATPDRPAAVARELTKIHEEIVRGTLTSLGADRDEWRGEVVIVLGPWEPETREAAVDDAALDARIDRELAAGIHSKTIAERLAAWSGRPKRDVYERVVSRKRRD
jgi:16S rRNA (cytidine1402-2'-O)-methyltransferase